MVLGIDGAVAWTTEQYVIRTNLLDPEMKGWIDKFDEELEKRLDDTSFVEDVGADLYIDDVDESD